MATFYGKRDKRFELQEEPEPTTPASGIEEQQGNDQWQEVPQTKPLAVVGGNPMPVLPQRVIDEKSIKLASETLAKYKAGKSNLEQRIIEDEQWWKLRHWDVINRGKTEKQRNIRGPEPSSAWLFNAITNKHADAMDNYPTPVVLPRERSDEESAQTLSEVLPVIFEYNEFEETYSTNWWEKLKHGTGIYGIFWNSKKDNGLGDIDIKNLDILKVFWEPGITDIQSSRNLFICDLVDTDLLDDQYPELKGKLKGDNIKVEEYIYDDSIDTTGKSLVVDWYYKRNVGGKVVLHYCKYVGDNILYASENDPQYQTRGYYDHGKYPVVFDSLFPEKGTPHGFGYVAICKSPQLYIDKLGANLLENSLVNTKPRFFVSTATNIDNDKFADWNKQFVPVEGSVDDTRIKQILTQPMSGVYMSVYDAKIEEMKDTASNRDVNSGSAGSGIRAASAIAALQEAGNKTSRDMISAAYRAQIKITTMCIELMKQFYDETRVFRITADNGQYEFIEMNKAMIGAQPTGVDMMGNVLFREPVFDLKIKAQKRNPFSQMEANERAKELYSMGFFAPEKAQESLMALDMMDFEGIDKIKDQVREGQTLLNLLQQYSQLVAQLTGVMPDGTDMGAPMGGGPAPMQGGNPNTAPKDGIQSDIMRSRAPMTSYGQRLAKRSTPSIDQNSGMNTAVR